MELNKIYHGDSYELIKQIQDKSIDLVYIDIPYEMQSGGKGGGAFGVKYYFNIYHNFKTSIYWTIKI